MRLVVTRDEVGGLEASMCNDDEDAIGGVDSDVLERIGKRLRGSTRFSSVEYRPTSAPNAVVAEFDPGYLPAGVTGSSLRIRWFKTDDFNVHYER